MLKVGSTKRQDVLVELHVGRFPRLSLSDSEELLFVQFFAELLREVLRSVGLLQDGGFFASRKRHQAQFRGVTRREERGKARLAVVHSQVGFTSIQLRQDNIQKDQINR